jgi:hypothetical protein
LARARLSAAPRGAVDARGGSSSPETYKRLTTPLTKWFLALPLVTSAKNGIFSLQLSRQIDVKWDMAWLIKQKLMEVMRQRNSIYKLSGDVQIGDAYLGGELPAIPGKAGRGAEGKLPFVIAVATRDGRPIHMQLRRVAGFTKEAPEAYAAANIEPGSWVVSDGLNCFPGVKEAGMKHLPIVTGGGRPTHPVFQVGQHRPRQSQERHRRHLPQLRRATCRPLSGGLRVAFQPPLRSGQEPRTASPRRPPNPAETLPLDHGTRSGGDGRVIKKCFGAGFSRSPALLDFDPEARSERRADQKRYSTQQTVLNTKTRGQCKC